MQQIQAQVQVTSLHIAISFAVAIQCIKDQEASRKPPPLCHFVQSIILCISEVVLGFWQFAPCNKLKQRKNTSNIARLKVRPF